MKNIQHTQYIKYYNALILLYITLYYVFDIVTGYHIPTNRYNTYYLRYNRNMVTSVTRPTD